MELPTGTNGAGCVLTTPDAMVQELMVQIADALEPPIDRRRAERLQEQLADHIRNKPRTRRGMSPLVDRWDRDAPELRVVLVREAAEAAA